MVKPRKPIKRTIGGQQALNASAGGGGIGSTIGTIGGGIIGGVYGGPAGAAAGASIGGSLGGSVGNAVSPGTTGVQPGDLRDFPVVFRCWRS